MCSEQTPPNDDTARQAPNKKKTPRSKTSGPRHSLFGLQPLPASKLAAIHRAILPLTEPAVMEATRTARNVMKSMMPSSGIVPVSSLPAMTRPVTGLFDTKVPALPLIGFTERLWSGLPKLELSELAHGAWSVLDMSGWLPTSAQLNVMLPRIDLDYADQVSAIVDRLRPTMLPMASVQTIFTGLHESIRALLGNWDFLTTFGHRLAEQSLRAAKRARAAAIRGDRKAVEVFALTWLGIKKAVDWVIDAVIGALLENTWLDLADDDPATAIDRLRKETTAHRRGTQPLWERKVSRRRIALLDEPLTMDMTRADLLIGPDVRAFGRIDDPRVLTVLDQLSERDREIAQAYSESRSWDEAAAACNATPQEAESVRRKLKYRGKQVEQMPLVRHSDNDAA